MASNKTANYGLSQWEATDQVVRADFNSDNAKIDAAIKAAEDKAIGAQETADIAKVAAEAAYSPDNAPYVVGWYTGNNAEKRTIALGFTPQAVLVMSEAGKAEEYGGLAITGRNASCSSEGATAWVSKRTRVAIVEGGFMVSNAFETSSLCSTTNNSSTVYHYVALK